MKFSELDKTGWPDLQPYLDTCLLPVTGLTGSEAPWEMAGLAADAGAWLQPLELAFKGRTVTLPAFHYYEGQSDTGSDKLMRLCGRLRSSGYRYVVLISGRAGLLAGGEGADLVLQPQTGEEAPDPDKLHKAMADLWRNGAAG